MPYTDVAKNDMLDHLGTTALWVTAYDGDPTGAGTEVASSRAGIAWAAAASGSMAKTAADPALTINASATVSYLAVMNHASNTWATAGQAYVNVTDEVYGGSGGTYTITAATLDLNS